MSNREIKFRAWDRIGAKMMYQFPISFSDNYKSWDAIDKVDGINFSVTDNLNAHLMQYTGLKDKNGKEIYEGDIVMDKSGDLMIITDHGEKSSYDCYSFNEFIYSILYSEDHSGISSGGQDMIKVMGNIYENPEIIKKNYNKEYAMKLLKYIAS